MQTNFALLTTRLDTDARQMLGLSDLEIVTIGTRNYVIAAGEADGGFSSFEILADGSLVAADDVLFDAGSGTQNIRGLTSFESGGVTYVVPLGRYDDNMAIYAMDANGSFSISDSYTGATYSNLVTAQSVSVGGTSMFFSANMTAGLDCFTISAGALTAPEFMADTGATSLGDVNAMVSAMLHGRTFLFTTSAWDTGLTSFEVNNTGTLTERFNVTPGPIGFNAPSALAAFQIGPRAFVVMASAETDALLVFRVSAGGKLKLVDQLYDKSETRFERPSSLEAFEVDGRQFLLAAGSDDGLTLFEVNYRGRLKLITVVADEFDTTLDNISDIEVKIIGGEVYVFVSSASEHGFTQFRLDITTGDIINGGAVKDTLTGTSGDDTIYGRGRNDILDGGAGDDRLIDGRGRDILTGGSGADIFEFIADGKRDKITDFELHTDRLDFSDYANLYSFHDLEIRSRADGAAIIIGDEVLWIRSIDGQPIDPDSWVQGDFIFG